MSRRKEGGGRVRPKTAVVAKRVEGGYLKIEHFKKDVSSCAYLGTFHAKHTFSAKC